MDTSRMSFLGPGLARLTGATISVIGAGGGGSHIVQQLAHLGIETLVIIDADLLERSNVNRVVGSRYRDIGRAKAEILAENFAGLGGNLVPVVARAADPAGRSWIERSDLVIGAVDGMRSRNAIEYICRTALVPYIDIGLSIVPDDARRIIGIGGQVFTSLPGGPCMQCAEIITDEQLAGDREEYMAGAPEQQVISMNGILASQAVTAAINLLTDFAPEFLVPPWLQYDGLLHELKIPAFPISAPCPHYLLASAGWRVLLPPKRVSS